MKAESRKQKAETLTAALVRFAGMILILAVCRPALAVDKVTASVSFTNASGTTNGQTITVNGDVRTWTNVVNNALSQVLTNNSATGAKTNLYRALGVAPLNGGQVVELDAGATNLSLVGNSGLVMAVTLSAGWGSVSYSTQTVSGGTAVRIPTSIESAAQQTNINSGLVAAVMDSSVTNVIPATAFAVSTLVGLPNSQTITGQKIFSSPTGRWGGSVSNSASISGTVSALTNGLYETPILDSPITTNLINYGNAISSPGTGGSGSEHFGASSIASAADATAVGNGVIASGVASTGLGKSAIASGDDSVALGTGAHSTALNSIALGNGATTGNQNSTAIGYLATTTASNQIMLGSSGISTVINNTLQVGTGATFGNGVTNLQHTGTNTFPAGSDVSYGRFAVSSLANGNNAGVVVGTNVFVQVSGPSAGFTICGMAGGRDGKVLKLMNKTGFTMTLANESGVDSTAANRIQTGKTADVAYTNNPCVVNLIYDGNASRWVVEGINQ